MKLFATCAAIIATALSATVARAQDLPAWAIGPFTRPPNAEPVIKPEPASVFSCPMRNADVHWEKLHTFNPAAVVKDGKIFVLYRAEDDSGAMKIGGHSSRGGLAYSDDGIHFTRLPKPVLFPADDSQKKYEWTGGCEDPRLAEREDGTCVVTFTQYNGHDWRLGLASSKDLVTWTKHGSPFEGTKHANWHIKSAAIVHEIKDGKLVAAKVNGKYLMYFGEESVHVATSENLIAWKPLEDARGRVVEIMKPRHGFFDSTLTEIGPQAIRTTNGIVVFYNGKNADPAKGGDPALPKGVYACGQALFSADEPTKLLARLDAPFFKPELAWEKTGQYAAGTTFSEGLALFKGKWFLYYGCADTFVGVATAPCAK